MNPPEWVAGLRAGVDPPTLHVADYVWGHRAAFIEWPQRPFLFMKGSSRGKLKYHAYDADQKALLRAIKLAPDGRSNGPAVMAFHLAGGTRPLRASGRGWTIHHIYDGQFAAPKSSGCTHAVTHGDYFTEAAGLVAIHPVADALAGELAYFAWLLRFEAYSRFGFDPDGAFNPSATSPLNPAAPPN